MKKIMLNAVLFSTVIGISSLASCGSSSDKPAEEPVKEIAEEPVKEEVTQEEAVTEETSLDLSAGEAIYKTTCLACHQASGEGLPNVFPPLAKADYLMEDKVRAIKQVKMGSDGEITVNGEKYNGVMPPQALDNQQIADVLTYVMNSWGNEGGEVTIEEVNTALAE